MATERLISLRQPEAWAAALEGIPHGFAHRWECCEAMQRTSGLPTFLYVLEDAGGRAACPFAERRFAGTTDICTPFGFSGFAQRGELPGLFEHWRAFARARGHVCGYFALHPLFSPAYPEDVLSSRNSLFLLDLRQGAEAALQAASRSRRRTIQAWRASGQSFVEDPGPLREFLLRNHAPFLRGVGANAASILEEASLDRFCRAPGVELVGLAGPGGITAVHAFAATPHAADSLFFLGSEAARPHMPALFWEAIERCARRGIPWFNLGGGANSETDPVARSKILYGAQPQPIRRACEIYDPAGFDALCRAHGAAGSYFPPYRAGRGTNE